MKAWNSVEDLCTERDYRKTGVIIGVGFVVTKENWREVIDATLMAKSYGVDNIRISAVFQSDDEEYFTDFYHQASEQCAIAEKQATSTFRVFNNFGDRIGDLIQHSPDYKFCGYQNFSTYIGADLNVYRCCVQAYNPRGLLGSLKDQRFKELWNSPSKRDDFANFDARECQRCMFNNKNRTINYALAKDPAHVNFV